MTVDLDRFSQGLPDPQNVAPLEQCQACGREIYPGEDVYILDGYIIHATVDCLISFVKPGYMKIEEALGVQV